MVSPPRGRQEMASCPRGEVLPCVSFLTSPATPSTCPLSAHTESGPHPSARGPGDRRQEQSH